MNRIDTFAGESKSALSGGSRSTRSASFEMDHGAFENALDRSREDASEAGYGAASVSSPAPKDVPRDALRNSSTQVEQARGAVADVTPTENKRSRPTQGTNSSQNDGKTPPTQGGESVKEQAAAVETGASANDAERLDSQSAGADVSDAEASEAPEATSLGKELTHASEVEVDASESEGATKESSEVSETQLAESDSDTAGEPDTDMGGESDLDMSRESDASSSEEEAQDTASDDLDAEMEFSELKTATNANKSDDLRSTLSQPTGPSDSAALLEARGKQVFARSAIQQKTVSAPSTIGAGVDVEDLASQIDKARGTMSGGRARIVLGEGSERVALLVQLKNGSVSVDVRAADGALAENLARSSDELAKALGRHGLTLGDMSTGSEARGDGTQQEMQGEHGPPLTEKDTAGVPVQTLRRAGIRVVA